MKNINTQNRIARNLKPALLTLCLGLLISAPVMTHASEKQATSGTQTVQAASKSLLNSILDYWWWIRR